MTQFNFIKADWPSIYVQAAKAETYALPDPRAACFYARLALEMVVEWLYDHEQSLRLPYDRSLSALIGEPSFKHMAGGIAQKAYVIKNYGNKAVHGKGGVQDNKAISSVRELHHICFWLARNYARSGPPQFSPFDAGKLPRTTSVTPQRLAVLQQAAKKFEDEYYARKKAEEKAAKSESEFKALQAERDKLLAEMAAIKAANAKVHVEHDLDEETTRSELIDILLNEAGWDLKGPDDLEYEIHGMRNDAGVGYVDYVLWGKDGKPLAVVEAKSARKDARAGEQQAKLYADAMEAKFGQRPVIFYTNGYEHWIWDDLFYPARRISGFLSQDELQTLMDRRQTRRKTADIKIDPDISGRYYQERAIRRVCETFEQDKQRKALLVMATGSGKTRTSISLVDVLMKAGWVKRVLFLADRTALVQQATNAFKAHLGSASPVNLLKDKDAIGRVYLSTYPTMINLINQEKEGEEKRFGPGHFDLIVVDEAHRSIYKKYGAIFDYFDSLLVGLTATPKDEVDRDTYNLFGLETGVPTDAYDLDNAVEDKFLVPPKAMSVPLKIVRTGLKYDELSEDEKEQWDMLDWGEDEMPPDDISAAEINKRLFNEDTVDKVLEHLMLNGVKVDDGDKLGKTIIFAKNSKHAQFIKERFDVNYPHLANGDYARTIDYKVNYAQTLIDDFSTTTKYPQIAISVDMLDTGIDVPDVVNLVFFKIVRSKTKFWQMIGRGTRLRPELFGPDRDKAYFVVFDYCQNFEYFNENPDKAESAPAKSLGHALFLARMDILDKLDELSRSSEFEVAEEQAKFGGEIDLRGSLADRLHEQVSLMPLENFIVRPKRRYVEDFSERDDWEHLGLEKRQTIREHLSDLPSQLEDKDIDAKRFDLLILRAQLAVLKDSIALEKYRRKIMEIASALETKDVPLVQAQMDLILEIQTDPYWEDITPEILEIARRKIRNLVRLIDKTERKSVYSDFEDVIGAAEEIEILESQTGFDKARFKAKVQHFLKSRLDHIAVQKIHTNQVLTPTDLSELEKILAEQELYSDEASDLINDEGGLSLFIRRIIGLERGAAREVFAEFIRENDFNSDQIEFVDMIISALSKNGIIDPAQLYDPPFTHLNAGGLGAVFDDKESAEIIELVRAVKKRAVA